MAQKKRLSKFLPRLLAAAVAAATLIGSGGIGGISVYAAEMGAAGTEDIQPADSAENEGTETEGAGTEVWDEDTGSGSGQEETPEGGTEGETGTEPETPAAVVWYEDGAEVDSLKSPVEMFVEYGSIGMSVDPEVFGIQATVDGDEVDVLVEQAGRVSGEPEEIRLIEDGRQGVCIAYDSLKDRITYEVTYRAEGTDSTMKKQFYVTLLQEEIEIYYPDTSPSVPASLEISKIDLGQFTEGNGLKIRRQNTTSSYSVSGASWGKASYGGADTGASTAQFTNLRNSSVVQITYANIGTYNDKAVGARVTFTELGSLSALYYCETSFYNGWWFIGNESASRAQVKVDYFYVDTQETIRFDGNSFMTFNSLNTGEYASPLSGTTTGYTASATNVAVTRVSGVPSFRGSNNNFTDYLGGSTFYKNSVSIPLYATGNTFYLGCNTHTGYWISPSSASIAIPRPENPYKTENGVTFLEETEEGQEITYRVSQKVHTLGVETVSKYSALKFVDKLPAEVDYVSAWLEDAAGNKLNAGTVSYDKDSHKVTYTFSSSYLASSMAYQGETYTLVINTTVNGTAEDDYFYNSCKVYFNSMAVESNEVKAASPYRTVEAQVTGGRIGIYDADGNETVKGEEDIKVDDRVKFHHDRIVRYEPDEGYLLDTVTVDGKKVDITEYPSFYTFSDVTQNHKIVVSYVKPSMDKEVTIKDSGCLDNYSDGQVIDRAVIRDGDKTIAHIDAERNVKFYDEKLPEIVKAKIRKVAATEQMDMSVTQKVPIFSTPPQIEPEIQAEKKVEAAPAGKSPVEIYREALSMLSDVVRQSSFYSYLRDRETDYDGAAAELDNELGFFINEIAESQPELYDAFQSLPMFRAWMVEDILERTYQDVVTDSRDAIERHTGDADAPEWAKEPETDAEQAVTENPETVSVENSDEISPEESGRTEGKGTGEAKTQDKKKGRTLPELNYRAFLRLFPDFTKENYTAMQFKAGESMMPLHIEAIGNGEISIAHYYRQNGDTMADPEMTFRIDHEKGTLEPLTYQQDSLGLYQQVYPEPGRWIPKLRKDLNRFANQWFHNIEIQNYIPERAVMEADGNRTEISYQDGKPVIQEEPAPVLEETEKGAGTKQEDTNLTPNVEEYLNLKAEHPDKLVGVEVGEYILFYGKDAQAAAPALSAKLLTKEIPGLGETPVTGGKGWQAVVKDLLEHGQSVVIARPDPESGENAPYEIVKERDIADYIPLGMKLTIDGRHMEVDSIDYENGRVSLKDLDMQGWFPIFREESVPFVRECVEQEWENSLESGELPEEAPQAEKEAGGQEEETHTLADSADFKEAMRLLEDFCNSEYDDGVVDLGNPEHLEIAFTNTEDEQHDIQVEVNLLDHSISQFFDGVCVDKREYGSIRELIDTELSRLDFDELVRLDASVEKLLDRQGSSELEEAKRLIEDFCLDEYEQDSVDFSNLAKVPLAYGVTDSGGLEVQVNVDLIHFSLSQYVDGKCVEERQYDSLRELIDGELAFLDYDQLIYLEPGTEERLEAELNEKIRWEEMQGAREGVTPTEWETTGREEEEPPDMVEIEGGEIVTEGPAEGYSTGLPYDIVIEKLHFGPDRHNFHITDDALGTGGQKAKYQDNLAAIRTLTQIEAENRLATEQEQEVLSRYVGWGGLSQAFDADNEKWGKEYTELKELLTPAEYESARSTVLNAHYTSPIVIKAMYEAVKRMDFTPGNILEPSCGIGNFFGLVPEEFEKSNLYGVELDSLTGRIAKQLYQRAEITVGGFETTEHPNDFFDLAVGNVPFGEYKVHDKQYDKQNLLIHDYFLTKTLDKVRPGGVVAFITSKGTMDKANGKVREALAQKADLLGAVRLPNNAFKANAGTDVTADILFFQKRGSAPEKLPDWVNVGQTEDGIPINNYYLQNPDMVLGKMAFWENMYGNATETACVPLEGADLKEQLAEAVTHIRTPDRELLHMDAPEQAEEEKTETIPADPNVRNFSFTEKGGKLYFRENSRMKQIEVGKTPAARIRGMIAIRDSARRLIDLQLSGAEDAEIGKEQAKLNALYDNFQKKYGLLGSAGNRLAFRQDSSYPLLCSLEVLDEEGNLKRKADMFTKRTIQHRQPVTSVDTAVEALGVSIGERACVDLGFMASLMGGGDKIPQIISDLKGIIFKDPDSGPAVISEENTDWHKGWQTADEYLSGDVRRKLEKAKKAAEEYPEFSANVEALLAVQPKDLTAPEISVRIGAPWIDTKYYKQFLFELLQTPGRLQNGRIDVLYSDVTGEWRIKGKSEDSITNTRVHTTYGTKRINAYEIFEASLNQRSVQIFDTHRDADGKEIRVLNEKETAIAQQKQDAMKEAFHDWIFKDPERRTDLCAVYNRMFNSTRPREYDGRHINFIGMNPEIKLEPHQRNAVARILYGGNTLLAHVVGAGKTYEMIAAAMESKRLGLCKKSIMVVPNHLTEQWGGDFLTLYPGAKVLVATKKDFEPKNRKRFCARIATGDYDAVIIGHSQFEKIPISPERQMAIIQDQIDEIVFAIAEAKANREEKFTVKQMEKTKKNLEAKIKKLYDKKKDDTVTFEELGVDRLFVDEAHSFKNLYMHTKMRNVAGISQTDAQKSSDMFAKCRYMDEITGGRGVVFATGTPVSNSMVELYTMMRYLQYSMLEEGYRDSTGKIRSLKHFDNWAATFGEQVTAVELKPEGTGFRLKTRFARFYNLPELINRWKEAADIQTADMLKLPVPEAEYVTVQTEPSEAQKAMVKSLADRAEKIRKEKIDPRIDNMLKITSDGRKLALDQRIMNPLLPDDPGSKVNACVDNVFRIWQESAETKGTQLIFSDLSTPKGKAEPKKEEAKENTEGTETEAAATEEETAMEASVYEDIRKKLIAKGIPPQEIAFIHDAGTETQKAELFAKVRNGQVRVLLGSTQKMGAGTNVQTKLVASHDLDCPWRPADLEQRAGRIVRRGNENDHVKIYRYVTKGTFDAYTWGLVESKQKFIGQIMTSKSPARSIEDVDATALSYAEVKMLATGDVRIKEKMDLDIQVTKLKMLKSNHQAQQYEMQDKVRGYYPNKIKETQLYIDCLNADLPVLEAHPVKEDAFSMTVMGNVYTERKEAGKAIVAACRLMDDPGKEIELGEYRGFPMKLMFDGAKFKVTMKQHLTHTAELSDDVVGNITRINNALEKIPQSLANHKENMARLHKELESAKEEAERPFAQEAELQEKSARLAELNTVLDNEEKGRGTEPPRETEEDAERGNEKPSILKTLKEYERPAPANFGAERGQEREAI